MHYDITSRKQFLLVQNMLKETIQRYWIERVLYQIAHMSSKIFNRS